MELSYYTNILNSGYDFNQREIDNILKTLKKMLSKGGVVLITENDKLITTYKYDSYNRKKAIRK